MHRTAPPLMNCPAPDASSVGAERLSCDRVGGVKKTQASGRGSSQERVEESGLGREPSSQFYRLRQITQTFEAQLPHMKIRK